jgi:uncharacterized protein
MATIKVRGTGSVTVEPDEAVISFEIATVADAPADAFATTSERAAALAAVLDDAGIERNRRSTVGISLHEHQEFEASGTSRRAHRASTLVNVRLADTDSIPPLLQAAVERADAYLRGPFWRLADAGAAEAEACRLAIDDATRRAEAYAGALGSRVGRVDLVEEVAVGGAMPGGGPTLALAARQPPELYPAELAVAAVVDVVFALEPA